MNEISVIAMFLNAIMIVSTAILAYLVLRGGGK